MEVTLPNGRVYKIEAAKLDTHSSQIRNIITTAAHLGNNVCHDEFDEESLREIFDISKCFLVTKHGEEEPIGMLYLHPTKYSRLILPLVGYFQIILAEDVMHKSVDLYCQLVDLAVKLTVDMKRGYLGVMTSLFMACDDWYSALRQRWFTSTAILPSAGGLHGETNTDFYLLYREFRGQEIQGKQPSNADIVKAQEEFCNGLPHYSVDTSPIPTARIFRDGPISLGTDVLLRAGTKEDGPIIYKHLQQDTHGIGYSENFMTLYNYFYHMWLTKAEWTVVQTPDGTITMSWGAKPSRYTRPPNRGIVTSVLIRNPELPGVKFSQDVPNLSGVFTNIHNCQTLVSTALLTNPRMLKFLKYNGNTFGGCMPAMDMVKGKIIDGVINVYQLNTNKQASGSRL